MTHRLGDIKDDWDRGARTDATHMIMFRDDFSLENYPVYIHPGESIQEAIDSSKDVAVELYSYALPWETQAAQERAWNL